MELILTRKCRENIVEYEMNRLNTNQKDARNLHQAGSGFDSCLLAAKCAGKTAIDFIIGYVVHAIAVVESNREHNARSTASIRFEDEVVESKASTIDGEVFDEYAFYDATDSVGMSIHDVNA